MPVIKKQARTAIAAPAVHVLSRITKLGAKDQFLKVMLYGESATGKTTLWATFPGRILVVVCSGGNKTGETRSLSVEEYGDKIDEVTLINSLEMRDIITAVRTSGGYSTVVLDHVSGFQDLVLKEILNLEEIPAQKSWGLATQQQYGQCSLQCKEHLRSLLNLDVNVVIIGQERTFKGKEDGIDTDVVKPTIGVAVAPALAAWLNPACDYVMQTFKRPRMEQTTMTVGGKSVILNKRGKGVDYCVRVEPHDVYYTKFRVPRGHTLPEVIVDPTYEKINSVILGET